MKILITTPTHHSKAYGRCDCVLINIKCQWEYYCCNCTSYSPGDTAPSKREYPQIQAAGCIAKSIEWLGHGQSDRPTGVRFPTVAELTVFYAAATLPLNPTQSSTHNIPGGFFRGVNSVRQTGPGAHPVSCTMDTGSFPGGVKSGWGVALTPHPLLVPWSRKSRATPLLPIWAVRPVQSLSACTRVRFTLF